MVVAKVLKITHQKFAPRQPAPQSKFRTLACPHFSLIRVEMEMASAPLWNAAVRGKAVTCLKPNTSSFFNQGKHEYTATH